ncbi:SlyX family protein [Thiomicrorhabdus indica]|uniref:SlyX family protein n=1 Tax=Thiomicrorhabdus indica TaxID=2267253 RepID=UPI00102DBE81|nr:SlyX family protein [Thiomicrorhabdus indica]
MEADKFVEQLHSKLQEMEIQQTYQDDAIETMERTIAAQHQEIQLLNKKLSLLADYIKSLPKDSNIKTVEEEIPPPHY